MPVVGLAASLVLSTASPASAADNLLSRDASTFATGTGGWSATNGSLARVAKPAESKSGALRATATAAGNVSLTSGGGTATSSPAVEGATYAADAWVLAGSTSRAVQSVLIFYGADGRATGVAWGGGVDDNRRDFTRTATANGVAPAGTRHAVLGIIVYGAARGEVHYVDTARIEQTAEPVAASAPRPLVGVFDTVLANWNDPTRVNALEAWQGRDNAVVGLYTNFDPANIDVVFPKMERIWDRGSVPMVSWMPWIGNERGPNYNAQIANGTHDNYIRSWATRMKTFIAGPDQTYGNADDRRAYLRFAHEANGNWYPYAPAYGGTPGTDFVAMWRHVHDVVESTGLDDATRLSWVFSVNNVDVGGTTMEALYPGEEYVDWVGIDGYNWGTSEGHTPESPSQVFDRMTARLRAVTTKPLGVNEVGATIDGTSVDAKAAWISDYFAWVKANGIGMTMWFNAYSATWEVFGGSYGDEVVGAYNAYATYRTAMQDPVFVSPDPSNARLLTDAQFTGR